jgi:multicomponent Na+:H+ antiporter subunit G
MVIDLLSWAFLLAGAFFMVVAGIGVLRLPDLFTRMHAAGLKDTLGTALTLIGLMLQAGFSLVSVKLVLIWAFIWFTSPVASHAVARAALLSGHRPIIDPGAGSPPQSGPSQQTDSSRGGAS